ncbi:MAG: YfiR family protein, partial [Bacteroidota bacterium]
MTSSLFSQERKEDDVIVAFVNAIINNIDWEDSEAPLHFLAISKRPSLLNRFEQIDGVTVHGRKIQVTRSAGASIPEQVDIVYLDRYFNSYINLVNERIKGKKTLLISYDLYEREDIMIDLQKTEGGRLLFEVNSQNIENQGLKILPE